MWLRLLEGLWLDCSGSFRVFMVGNRKNIEKGGRVSDAEFPRLLPLKEAARYLGLSLWAMRERCWSGDLRVVRFKGGRKIFLDVRDLEKFIEENKDFL